MSRSAGAHPSQAATRLREMKHSYPSRWSLPPSCSAPCCVPALPRPGQALEEEYAALATLLQARSQAGLTQEEVAARSSHVDHGLG